MTTSPYALVQMSVDAGGPQFGGLTLAGGNVIQLSGVSTVGWTSQLWEIYEYPVGYSLPSGWTNVNGIYTSTSVTPSSFTISAAATRWGKYLWRLTVNAGLLNGVAMGPLSAQPLIDELSGAQVLSPNYGLHDIGFRETNQFDSIRQWIGELKKSLQSIDSIALGTRGLFSKTLTAAQSYDLTASESSNYILKFVSNGANVIRLPPGADATAFTRYVWNASGGGTITVKDTNNVASAGTALASGTGAVFSWATGTVKQMSAAFTVV